MDLPPPARGETDVHNRRPSTRGHRGRRNGSSASAPRSSRATPPARPSCSPPRATGATSSRSPGTSRRSRAARGSRTCSSTRSAHAQPRGWHTTEEPTTADGVTDAWIEFETEVGRGKGHLRLIDGKAWTLLTALDELKGHEQGLGPRRPKGVQHGADPERQTWLEDRQREAEELGHTHPAVRGHRRRRAGRDRAWARGCASCGCRRSSSSATRARATRGATATSRCACTTRSGTTTCRTSSSRRTGRCSRPRTRSRDWLEMYTRVMELNYWGSTHREERALRRGGRRVGAGGRARRRGDHAAPEAARAGHRACPAARTRRASRAWIGSRATSTTPPSTRAPMPTGASGRW